VKCPFCSFSESKVIDSRPVDDGVSIRRRRECMKCEKRFTTYEKVENIPIMVIKKDKTREPFDSEKLLGGLFRACEKRPISTETLENVVEDIEGIIQNTMEREVTTAQIGELVMERLKEIDEVAYVRFASVYRQFKDIDTFMSELNKLLTDRKN